MNIVLREGKLIRTEMTMMNKVFREGKLNGIELTMTVGEYPAGMSSYATERNIVIQRNQWKNIQLVQVLIQR